MKLSAVRSIALLLVLLLGCSARATLIGDTITLVHGYPDIGTAFESHDVLVQAGSADAQAMLVGTYIVNPEAQTIYVSFVQLPGYDYYIPASLFDGLIVSGINDTILGVSIDTNFVYWSSDRLSWDAHSVSANWQGFTFTDQNYFNITLTTGRVGAKVPDTGSTVMLFGASLAGVLALRRRIRLAAN